MGFFRRIAGLLGLSMDEHHPEDHPPPSRTPMDQFSGLPRKGFSVPIQVVLDRPQSSPLLLPCTSGEGGVQGLKWYAKHLKMDEDRDVADEFLEEVSQDALSITETHHSSFTFKVKHKTRPAKVRSQFLLPDGRFQQCWEDQGALQ